MGNILCYVHVSKSGVTGPIPAHMSTASSAFPGTTVYPFASYSEAGEFALSKRAELAGISVEKRRRWALRAEASAFTEKEVAEVLRELAKHGYEIRLLESVQESHEDRVRCGRSFVGLPGSWSSNDCERMLGRDAEPNICLKKGDVVRESIGALGMYEFFYVVAAPQ